MSPERWDRIRALFDAAADLAEAEVDEFLQRESAGDTELYNEVQAMLEQHRRAGFLDRHPLADASAPPFEPGAMVAGRYRILRQVGSGGMGQVFEAEDTELRERVALKTLHPEVAAEAGMIARFKREIQLSRKIGHAHVCRVFDLARHPVDGFSPAPIFFLTMEFLAGETLSERIEREGRIPRAEAMALLSQMADALDAAHRIGIIHRDFKPSNVMLVPEPAEEPLPRAVVTDFGLARQITQPGESTVTASGRIIGTIDYMAPELFSGSPATPASDAYALGMVACKMATGALPFGGESPLAGVVQRAGQPLPPALAKVSGLDPTWERALARMLDADPAKRFTTCRDFITALRGESHSVTLKLPVMTGPRMTAAAALAALLIAAPLAWRAWEHARAQPSQQAQVLYRRGAADLLAGAYFAATRTLGQAAQMAPGFALAHAGLAQAWASLDFPEKASQEMLLARRQDLSSLSRLDRLRVEAIDLTLTREFAAAAAKYEEMVKIAGNDPGDLYLDLGRAYENAGQPDKATESYRKAAEGPEHNPAAWLALAVLYGRRGNAAKADEAFRQAEQQYRADNNLEGLTELAFQRGAAASDHDKFEDSSRFLSQALETAQLAGNVHQEVRSKLWLSANAFRSGDASKAEAYAREALDTARVNRIDSLAVRGLINLGHAYNRKRDSAGAEHYYQEALILARAGGAARLTAISLLSLAALHDTQARYKEAESEAAEALPFYQANGFVIESFNCLVILGRAHLWGEDDAKGAEDLFQKAAALAAKTPDRGLQALAEESLGMAMIGEENYPAALPPFQKELELSTIDERRGYARLNCAETLWILGRYPEADEALRSAEDAAPKFPPLHIALLRVRAEMSLSQEHYRESIACARQALDLDAGHDPRQRSDLKGILGLAMARSGDSSEGLRICRESLSDAIKVGETILVIKTRIALAAALMDAGDRAAALGILRGNEPDPVKYPEVRWRALAIMSRADPSYAAGAAEAFHLLERMWGADAFRLYQARPDIERIASPLFRPIHAK